MPGRRAGWDVDRRFLPAHRRADPTADKVAVELGGADGPVLSTLLKFVTIGENEPTRRRVRRSALTDAQWPVVQAFIAARLLTSAAAGDDAILEVAHEALFRHWASLQQAIEASADQLRWRADLERWAKDWETSGRQDAYLLRDERLKALMPPARRSRVVETWGASPSDVVVSWCGLSPSQRLTLEPVPVGYSGLPPCRARVADS
ncbi:MAG TPA: hypothetical protein VIY28_10575 [Pseudonocardiaceae bacterium]